ncbi:UGSC family (seleno)protein [Nesterenkonia flava]|uniref:UGSC family (Seleno)protein n=1 Tax=Nesterenkonia flava TaxID=469799 RepID=A0ABU1FQY0_9MICC|nr:UGSC family (seleno)protein [Nesterenkonia flava]MDR5710598.1 UGSC family (seleno)protein [Nesterenkonia flava]
MTILTTEPLLDPTGASERDDDATLAPRPGSLTGLRLGLLDNTKTNATALLENIASALQERHGLAHVTLYTKDYFGTPVKDELLEQIAADCDAVVTAVGDCGSCSAATVADGILFERAGIPAVSITSDAFFVSGEAIATVQGFPGYEFLAVPHPVASLTADELSERARDLVPQVERILGVTA